MSGGYVINKSTFEKVDVDSIILQYEEEQAECGLKVGDSVLVKEKYDEGKLDIPRWLDAWLYSMDAYIGKTGTINYVDQNSIQVKFEDGRIYSFPYFVLEKC